MSRSCQRAVSPPQCYTRAASAQAEPPRVDSATCEAAIQSPVRTPSAPGTRDIRKHRKYLQEEPQPCSASLSSTSAWRVHPRRCCGLRPCLLAPKCALLSRAAGDTSAKPWLNNWEEVLIAGKGGGLDGARNACSRVRVRANPAGSFANNTCLHA
jgi:hypothetical protein